MRDLPYVAALGLALVFAAAAYVKVRDRSATATAFLALRVPRPATTIRLVPVLELAIAAALVAVPGIGALAALVTLAFFTTFLAARVREGVTVGCACFGGAADRPLSWVDVVRNAMLAVAAFIAAAAPRATVPSLWDFAIGAAIALAAFGLLRVGHRYGDQRAAAGKTGEIGP